MKLDAENLSGHSFVARLIDVIEENIVPLTRDGVSKGNKVFGAAILRKSDLSVVLAGTNNETENPLWHGEVHTLKLFYEIPASDRPQTMLSLPVGNYLGGVRQFLLSFWVRRHESDVQHSA